MRIGIDGRLWNETGIGRYIRNLVAQLAEIDIKNEYFLYLKKTEYNSVVTPGNNFRKRLANIHWHSIQEQVIFPQILYKDQLDLVHFPYFSFPLAYARPFVITIHDLILFHYPTGKASQLPEVLYGIKLRAYKHLMHHAATHAKKIIAVSNATKNEIIKQLHVDAQKIVVTHEGVDIRINSSTFDTIDSAEFAKALTEKKAMEDNQFKNPYFLYVGNAYPHKNLNRMLSAYADFRKEVSQVDLILVGKQDYFYHELQRELLKLRIENSVSVLSNVSDKELVKLYKNAIALVMPSLMEGFGLPTVEAMANNCLVAASAIPAFQEICGDAAVYFDPFKKEDIVKVLKQIYFNQYTYTNNKKKGLERAKAFSWRTMAEQTLQVYQSVPPDISNRQMARAFSKRHSFS